MGAWFTANRLLAEVVAGALLVGIVAILWSLHDHRIATAATVKCENAVSEPAKVAELQAALGAKTLEVARLTAEAQEHDALAQIAARPITRAVWLCNDPVRPRTGAGPKIDPHAGLPPGDRADEPGTRIDIRARLERFKLRYETVIEGARAALAECPTVQVEPLGDDESL